MKEILIQYGALFLSFFIFLAIVSSIYGSKMWQGKNFPQLVGQTAERELEVSYELYDNPSYQSYMSKAMPVISVHYEGLKSATSYEKTSIFHVVDYRGLTLIPDVKPKRMDGIQLNGSTITFNRAGCYDFTVTATDSDGRTVEADVSIPVQQKM